MNHLRELIEDAIVDPKPRDPVVKPYVLSHGTLESRSLRASRKFYEEFLGLECVRHSPGSMAIRLAMRFHIMTAEMGALLRPVNYLNHWGLDVQSREEVDAAHAAALANRERYGIGKVTDCVDQHGVYSFYFEDLDQNWWEIQYYAGGFQHDDMFDYGDVYPMDGS